MTTKDFIVLLAVGSALTLWTLLRLASGCESKAEREADDPDKESKP